MKLAEFSVRRWQFTILMFLMLGALGLASWKNIPRGEDPVFPIPTFMVIAVYPGASPNDMEQLVIDKIEDKLGALEGVWKLYGRADDGLATIRLEFQPSVDADRKEDEVLREMNALRPELPSGLARLQIIRASATNVNILQAALVSENAPYAQLDSIAKRFEKRLKRVPGIKKAERWASPEREVQVSLDLDRLARANIPPMQVMQAIGSDNITIPGGSVDAGPIACSSNTDCPPELFCMTANCGARGVCAPRPRVCDRINDPVCGCNRRTYTNPCEANADGQSVASRGECASLLDAGAGTPDRLPPVCAAVLCAPGMMCCDVPGAAFYGMCFDPRCLSCCVPGMRVDAGAPDAGPSRCSMVRCSADTTCCMRPGSINDGMCFPNSCPDCCR